MNIANENMIKFENETSLKEFILGGKAIFTLESIKTNRRYTYKIKKSKDNKIYFVSYLYGNDNMLNYRYLANMDNDLNFKLTQKSPYKLDSFPVAAVKFFIDIVKKNIPIPNGLNVYHSIYCSKCGRLLTDPASIKSGIGPICISIITKNILKKGS
jgi:hypothetical protein